MGGEGHHAGRVAQPWEPTAAPRHSGSFSRDRPLWKRGPRVGSPTRWEVPEPQPPHPRPHQLCLEGWLCPQAARWLPKALCPLLPPQRDGDGKEGGSLPRLRLSRRTLFPRSLQQASITHAAWPPPEPGRVSFCTFGLLWAGLHLAAKGGGWPAGATTAWGHRARGLTSQPWLPRPAPRCASASRGLGGQTGPSLRRAQVCPCVYKALSHQSSGSHQDLAVAGATGLWRWGLSSPGICLWVWVQAPRKGPSPPDDPAQRPPDMDLEPSLAPQSFHITATGLLVCSSRPSPTAPLPWPPACGRHPEASFGNLDMYRSLWLSLNVRPYSPFISASLGRLAHLSGLHGNKHL